MIVSIYKNVRDVKTPFHKPVQVALDRIKKGASKELNIQIRATNSKEEQKALKSKLCGVCFNGTFNTRSIKGLEHKSGLIILDFDGFENEQKAKEFKESLKEDAYIFSAWISPSNVGVKVLVKIPIEGEHKGYFEALRQHFNSEHWDLSGSNIDRFCFESYDPDLFQNNNSVIWTDIYTPDAENLGTENAVIRVTSVNKIIDNLLKWWQKKYGFVQGQKNNNLFKLAASFNTFGVAKNECEHVLNQFCNGKNDKEIQQLINSAYKNVADFHTKDFEDTKKQSDIEKLIRAGISTKEINAIHPEISIKEIESCLKVENTIDEYWTFDKNGNAVVDAIKYKMFLQQNNFYKYFPSDNRTFTFIKTTQGIVEETNEGRIKDFVLENLSSRENIGNAPIKTMLTTVKYFNKEFLSGLDNAKIKIKEDTADSCFLYFKNKVVKITKENIEEIEYLNIDDYVWRKQVIDRDFIATDHHQSVFRKFIWLVSGKDENRYKTLKSVIGYLLHSYKTSANNRAVIFNDETISDNPNGGSGKGLFCNALSKMKKVASIDGKNFEFTKSFPYQTVGTDTQLLVFDDVKKNFSFESLFSLITEGLTLEYKGQDAVKLPVQKSPKILITTNYTIGGVGGSFERRKFEVEFSSYFSNKYTPLDEFNQMFFDDWNDAEWSRFDNYMIQCTQFYLENGLVKNSFVNLELRKFIAETSKEFYDWASKETLPTGIRLPKDEIYDLLIKDSSDLGKWLRKRTLNKWLKVYADFHKYRVIEGKTNNNYWIEFEAPKGTWENPIELKINE